jgi:hypothetical protein
MSGDLRMTGSKRATGHSACDLADNPSNLSFRAGRPRRREGNFGNDLRGTRRQQEDSIGKTNGLLKIMGYQQRGDRSAFNQCSELVA